MSYFTTRSGRIVAGTLAGALALSVTPIVGFFGTAGAADALPPVATPTGAGNFCENASATEPFTDVSDADGAQAVIACLVDAGITTGTTATTYSPNGSVTRRQMVLFLKRLADMANAEDTGTNIAPLPADDGVEDFGDTSGESAAVKTAIDQLVNADVVNGLTATTFGPGENVSRRQMAAFVNRLQEFLTGTALPATGDYFDDDNGDSGEDNLNAMAEAGIFQGDGAGNVFPGSDLTRRQMANILLRDAEVNFEAGDIDSPFDAVAAAGCGIVTAAPADGYTFTDGATNVETTVVHDATNDTFMVDGAPASRAAFDAASDVGDEVCFVDDPATAATDADQHKLTNVAASSRNSGMIGNIDTSADTFEVIEPVSGVVIGTTKTYTGDVVYVDGAVTNVAGFEAALNEGDTFTLDIDAALNETFKVTNKNVAGTVGTFDVGTDILKIGKLGDNPLSNQNADFSWIIGTTNNFTIGGTAATQAAFEAALTTGDTIDYTRAGDVQTFRLTNVAPPAVTGVLTNVMDTGAADSAVLAQGATDVTVVYTAITVFKADGVSVTEAEFEAQMTAGDTITHQPDNPDVAGDQGSMSLTNGTLSGNLNSAIDTAANTYDVLNAQGNQLYAAVPYTGAVFGGVDRYYVNGTEVTLAVFEQYLDKVDVDATPDDTIQVVDNNTGAGVSISTDHKLTTDETI